MINILLNSKIEDIKKGYAYNPDNQLFTCLICGKEFQTGEVFSFGDKLYEAVKAVQFHIEEEHGDMFNTLASYPSRYTGLTPNQREMLEMLYTGYSDKEIVKNTGIAPSTVRRKRFLFKEKAKQAKLYLAIYETVNEAICKRTISRRKGRSLDDASVTRNSYKDSYKYNYKYNESDEVEQDG